MYPLNIILAGQRESLLAPVRQILQDFPATIEAEFSSLSLVTNGIHALPRSKDRPWLFVLVVESPDEFEHMRRIRESVPGHPILAVTPMGEDPFAVYAAMRAGAAQVVASPVDEGDFQSALVCISQMFGFTTGGSRVLVVSGVTGGCGATMLATNIAYELSSRRNEKVIVLELSPQMGMVAAYLDAHPRTTTYDLLTNIQRLDMDAFRNAVTPITDTLSIIPGPQQLLAPREVVARDVLQLLDFAKRLASVVIVDLPNSYSDVYFETLLAASHILLVGEQKLPSIRALKVVWDTLQRDTGLGMGATSTSIVINRFSPKMKDFSIDVMEKALGVSPIYTIANDHPAVSGAINRGTPLRVHDPKAKPLADIENLIDTVFGGSAVSQAPGVIGKLRRAFGFAGK